MQLCFHMEQALISFVIPAYNEQEMIAACVESIVLECYWDNYAEQIYSVGRSKITGDYEIIVVDNGSDDFTADCAMAAGATVVYHQPIKGTNVARQMGFEHSQGDLIAFIDADSVMPAGWLRAVKLALHDANVVAVSGPPHFIGVSKSRAFVVALYYTVSGFLNHFWPMTQGGNCVVRRNAMDAINGFDTSFTFYGDDADTAKRLSKVGLTKLVQGMWIWQSARRMKHDGWLKVAWVYVANYVWVQLTGRSFTKVSHDVRQED